MRSTALPAVLLAGLVSFAGVPPAGAAPAESGRYHIVLPRRALGAGESVELRLSPPPPDGVRVNYGVRLGTTGLGFGDAVYRAPYVIPPGTPPARVSASFSGAGVRATVTTEIELLPGSVPGSEDCLGPGQSFSTVVAGIEPEYASLDELPQLVQSVEAEYPRSPFVRGVEDTIHFKALLCRSGRVLDAYALPSYRDIVPGGMQPIEHDPKLVEAALVAVRQYVFRPGRKDGQAVALWIHTAVAFRR